jgi:hypothetical protein
MTKTESGVRKLGSVQFYYQKRNRTDTNGTVRAVTPRGKSLQTKIGLLAAADKRVNPPFLGPRPLSSVRAGTDLVLDRANNEIVDAIQP